ncbi:MAG TPA: response regulator transcription factor [Candidatus Dormibacteraeota bacterium]
MHVQVLICDDQEAFRKAAREVVNATDGFEVVGETETGEESVVAASRLRPNLVLMDVHLPGIDGLEASRRIKAEQAEVVVLLLSTYDREDFATRIAGSGASAFIAKASFGPDSLSDAWLKSSNTTHKGS